MQVAQSWKPTAIVGILVLRNKDDNDWRGGMILTDGEHSRSTLLEFRDYDKKALSPTKYNYKMTDLQASLGLNQLTGLPGFI